MVYLTAEQVEQFQNDGFLYLPASAVWQEGEFEKISQSCLEVQELPETPGKWMKYFEKSKIDGSRILNRVENFLDYHDGFAALKKLDDMTSELVKEKVVLYKEKINFKLPGGDGFKPHQDHAAGWWRYGQTFHINALVAIDEATRENGCLELVKGEHKSGLHCDEYKEIPEEKVNQWTWHAYPCKPGDVVFFDSFVPHRSDPNPTAHARRAMYLTWGKASEGDWRNTYYADKRISYPPDCERDPTKSYEYKI